MSEEQTPAEPVGDEVVAEEVAREEPTAEDQDAGQEPAGEAETGEPSEGDETVSRAKARREQRKAQFRAVQEERDALEAKVAEKDRRIQELETLTQSAKPPQQSDYDSYDEYLAELSAFKSMSAIDGREMQRARQEAEQERQALQAADQRTQAELAQSWTAQVEEAKTRYADFDTVVTHATNLPITKEAATMLATSDNGADVAYYLGTHINEAVQIANLNPVEQARAIGALEVRLSMQTSTNTPTKAPDPINPVKPKATASQRDPATMSPSEYRAWREKGGTF